MDDTSDSTKLNVDGERPGPPKLNVDLAITLSRFRQLYISNGCNATQAAIALGYAKKSAGSKGAYLKRLAFCGVPFVNGRELTHRIPFRQYLESTGVDDMRLAKKISEGMEAQDKIRDRNGEVIDSDPNWSAQYNFTKLGLEAGGQLQEPKQGNQVNVQINFETLLAQVDNREREEPRDKVVDSPNNSGDLIEWSQ